MNKTLKTCLMVAAMTALSVHAQAQTPLTDQALADQRGGYLTAGGISFDFGAVLTTYIDNQLTMRTGLNLTDAGASITRSGGGAGSSTTPLTVAGDGGDTRILQTLSASQLTNVALNTASNRMIRQDTALTIQIPGLDAFQAQIGLLRLGSRLSQAALPARLGQ